MLRHATGSAHRARMAEQAAYQSRRIGRGASEATPDANPGGRTSFIRPDCPGGRRRPPPVRHLGRGPCWSSKALLGGSPRKTATAPSPLGPIASRSGRREIPKTQGRREARETPVLPRAPLPWARPPALQGRAAGEGRPARTRRRFISRPVEGRAAPAGGVRNEAKTAATGKATTFPPQSRVLRFPKRNPDAPAGLTILRPIAATFSQQ